MTKFHPLLSTCSHAWNQYEILERQCWINCNWKQQKFYSYNCPWSTLQSCRTGMNTCSVPTCKQHTYNIPLPTVKLVQNLRYSLTEHISIRQFPKLKVKLISSGGKTYQIVVWMKTSSFPFCAFLCLRTCQLGNPLAQFKTKSLSLYHQCVIP